jgi:hypothetical protein
VSLKPDAAGLAEMDWVVAQFEYTQWKQNQSDGAQRTRATSALEGYYRKYDGKAGATPYALEAAYEVAFIRKSANDQQFRDWYKKLMSSFKAYKEGAKAATDGSRFADWAAEADYFFVNEQIEKEWDPSGTLVYNGTSDDVIKKIDKDIDKREKLFLELERIRGYYQSRRYLPILLAREGTLYDQHRQALVKGKIQAIDPAKEKQINDLEEKCRKILEDDNSSEKAKENCQSTLDKMDDVRKQLGQRWIKAREGYIHDMEMRLLQRYAAGFLRGRQFGVKDALVVRAVQRLAYYTDLLTDPKLREYLSPKAGSPEEKEWKTAYPDAFQYRDQMFKQARPGAESSPPATVETPVAPGPTSPAKG